MAVAVTAEVKVDVLVVGGGLTGLVVAREVRRSGRSCLVLEAGPRRCDPALSESTADHPNWSYAQRGVPFEWARVRALGGRSLLWGGWCAWPQSHNLRAAVEMDAPWPFTFSALRPELERAKRILGARTGRLPAVFAQAGQRLKTAVLPKTGAVTGRPARVLTALDLSEGLPIRTGAVALAIEPIPGGYVVATHDVALGSGREIVAGRVVLAASALESARLLLLSSGLSSRIARDQVGRNLTDHLVSGYALIVPRMRAGSSGDGPLSRAAYVPHRPGGRASSRRRYPGGFFLELRGPLPLEDLGARELSALGHDRRSAREFSYYLIHALGEAGPSPRRKMTLDPRRRDGLGRLQPLVEWQWTGLERALVRDMEEACMRWAEAIAPRGGRLVPFREALAQGGGMHEAGTCRMGSDERASVTDAHGQVHGAAGLFVADGGAMPTALDCYPTLTQVALALRVAKRVLS